MTMTTMNRSADVPIAWPKFDRAAAMATTNYQRRTRTEIKPLRRATDPQHGTLTAYVKGCACEPCRTANRLAQRRKRA
jgi:hypothetical protein